MGWLIAPISTAYLISVIGKPILVEKYLICTLPAFLLLAARGIRSFNFSIPTTAVILGIVVFTAVPSIQYNMFIRARDDNRQAAREFSIHYLPSDRVFFIPSLCICTFPILFPQTLGRLA